MKRNVVCTSLSIVSLIMLSLSLVPVAHATKCSTALTAGSWDYTYTGTLFTTGGPLPLASVGRYTQDSAGNVSGSQVRSVAGVPGVEDVVSTIPVQQDCTASAAVGVYVNGQLQRTAQVAFVFDSNGNHFRAIFQSLTLPNGTNVPVVITVEGNKLFPTD